MIFVTIIKVKAPLKKINNRPDQEAVHMFAGGFISSFSSPWR